MGPDRPGTSGERSSSARGLRDLPSFPLRMVVIGGEDKNYRTLAPCVAGPLRSRSCDVDHSAVQASCFTPVPGNGSPMTADHTVRVMRVGSTVIPSVLLALTRPVFKT